MRARRLPRLLAVLALAGGILVATAAPAWAHATLLSSSPADKSEVERAPTQITLTYNENVEVSIGAIRLFDCAGNRKTLGAPRHAPTSDHVVVTDVKDPLAAGNYILSWAVISADAHPVHGSIVFRVGAGANPNLAGCATITASAASPTVGVLFGAARAALFAGLALLLGGVVFLLVIARGTSAAGSTRKIAWIGWLVTVGATVATVLLQGPYAEGSGIGDAVKWTVVDDILHTRYGHIAELRVVALVVAAAVLMLIGRADNKLPPTWVWLSGVVVGGFLAETPGLAGHAATGDFTMLAVPIDTVHVAAMSIWFGGLVALLVAALGGGFSGALRRSLIAFSRLAFWCVVALVGSGVFASWRQVGFQIRGYLDTSYGNILLVKIAFVVAVFGLAAVSRSIVRARRAAPLDAPDSAVAAIDERTVRGLRRSVGGEVLIGIAVLVMTAVLVNAQPARSALAPRLFSTSLKGGQGSTAIVVNVTVDPARAGTNTIHVYIETPQGADLTIRNISGKLSLPSKGIAGFDIKLHRGGSAHFLVEALQVPIAGTWRLDLQVLLVGGFDDVAVGTEVRIR